MGFRLMWHKNRSPQIIDMKQGSSSLRGTPGFAPGLLPRFLQPCSPACLFSFSWRLCGRWRRRRGLHGQFLGQQHHHKNSNVHAANKNGFRLLLRHPRTDFDPVNYDRVMRSKLDAWKGLDRNLAILARRASEGIARSRCASLACASG